MAYFIYQNFPNQSVKIHRGDCCFCNNGIGLQRNILGDANGRWFLSLGNGYLTYQVASEVAQQLALQMGIESQDCLVCNSSIQR
ncbi:hypothetical protein [Adhaeribacter soli]|uniref:Uncharacterized protein n=1 Tax=Adhaeribacter soli TaxID=2607655 RepID=A0A5N1ISP9_9BACT|nr:hypothetical protein [Adhaeribacter soli]KAA9332688.1 hypothetical protein F0P94_11815 [Adhaeribacter soli]